jgi:hypothetical protein
MTKQHFTMMAAEFKTLLDVALMDGSNEALDAIDDCIQAFMRVAKQANPRFNAAAFLAACD